MGGEEKEKTYDWQSVTLRENDGQPFGCLIIYKMLPDIFSNGLTRLHDGTTIFEIEGYDRYKLLEIDVYEETPDALYTDQYDEDENDHVIDHSDETFNNDEDEVELADENNHNYAIVTRSFFPDETEIKALLYHVQLGNDVLLATELLPPQLHNALDVNISEYAFQEQNDSIRLNFEKAPLRTSKGDYRFKKNTVDYYISAYNTKTTTVIGRNQYNEPTLVKISRGKGNLYLCSTPLAFTNVNMVDPSNHEYISKVLSHLPNKQTYWASEYGYDRQNRDEFNDFNNDNENDLPQEEEHSVMELVWENEPLTWAFWMILGTALSYMLFGIKRRQRPIPVVKPITNTTIEFVKIIGEVYFQKGDHKNLAQKKISYFLEYIRSGFHVKTHEFTDDMYEKISERSGIEYDHVAEVFEYIHVVKAKKKLTQTELLHLTNLIEDFKNESNI